jgi:uncharacterized protein
MGGAATLTPDMYVRKSMARSASIAFLACILAFAGWAGLALAAPNYPDLTGQIVDNANLLSAEDKAAILSELQSLEGKSTDQVAVVTVKSLDGYAIEDYGIGLARKWQIGQKGKDNGILLIVAPNERKVRIEVGRRLEPVMTDTMSKIIITNAMLPKFRRGDYPGGIRDGVRDIKDVLLGDAEAVKERAKGGPAGKTYTISLIHLLVFAAIIALIFWQMKKAADAQRQWEQNLSPDERRRLQRERRRNRGGNVIVIPGSSGDWGGGWSGGGSSGGGWSGGGGSFGGGGASGDW